MRPVPIIRRPHLTEADIKFLLEVLARGGANEHGLVRLLEDLSELDRLLDNERILRALLESPECLRVSPGFYFYVLVRHAFRLAGIEDRDLAGYVASVLEQYGNPGREGRGAGGPEPDILYAVDFLEARAHAGRYEQFHLCVFTGNRFLVLTGVFPGFLRHRRERRGAPGIPFYEQVGMAAFREARDHPLAREFDLVPVFARLAEDFPTARKALNDFSERLILLD